MEPTIGPIPIRDAVRMPYLSRVGPGCYRQLLWLPMWVVKFGAETKDGRWAE
jgi:hypothetical protein